MTIRIDDAHAIKLIAERAGIDLGAIVHCIADYDDRDVLVSGVLLMNDNGHSMEIHSAGWARTSARHELLWVIFNYVFKVRKVKKLFGRVPANNIVARKLNKHLGFREEVIINDVFPDGEGLVIMSMYEEDCMFVNIKPPEVKFAPPEKTNIVKVHEYYQSNSGD